jgi:hypothetical protein
MNCYAALLIYRLLVYMLDRYGTHFTTNNSLDTLQNMNIASIDVQINDKAAFVIVGGEVDNLINPEALYRMAVSLVMMRGALLWDGGW